MPVVEIIDNDVSEILSEYEKLGGVLDFKFFRISGKETDKEAHLLAARHTLLAISKDTDAYFESLAESLNNNRDQYYKLKVDPIVVESGISISIARFFGPYFNYKTQRPILLEQVGKWTKIGQALRDYYYDDDMETDQNFVAVQHDPNNTFAIQGYADAFLRPPHSFGGNKTNFEIGKFFLSFNKIAFGDLDKLTIYSWPTNCSNYFDAGKEWWGSYFWTIYSSEKDWFIGIAASTTD
jgi:hypothetical protein